MSEAPLAVHRMPAPTAGKATDLQLLPSSVLLPYPGPEETGGSSPRLLRGTLLPDLAPARKPVITSGHWLELQLYFEFSVCRNNLHTK